MKPAQPRLMRDWGSMPPKTHSGSAPVRRTWSNTFGSPWFWNASCAARKPSPAHSRQPCLLIV